VQKQRGQDFCKKSAATESKTSHFQSGNITLPAKVAASKPTDGEARE